MKTGAWNVNIVADGMPQKIATAFSEFQDKLVGASYTPIAYIGSQVVNGINHAVLAEQVLTTGIDTKNIVVVKFNEREDKVVLSGIERVLEQGGKLGGVQINVQIGDDINKAAMKAFETEFEGFVGSVVKPVALLGTQVARGADYIFFCEVKPVTMMDDYKKAMIVRVNELSDIHAGFIDVLEDRASLNYAFTW